MTIESPARDVETAYVDPLSGDDWDELLERYSGASFFHTSAWAKVLVSTYGHKPYYLRFFSGADILGLLPMMEVRTTLSGRRGICLPFTDFCGPLMSVDLGNCVISKLLELSRSRCWKHFELRGPLGSAFGAVNAAPYYGHSLDVRGTEDRIFARFGSAVRRAIRKAQALGVAVGVTQSRDAVFDFYSLHVRTRRRHGLPPPPFSFFENIYREVVKKGSGFIVLAKIAGRAVAAAMFFTFRKQAVYKYGASDERFQESRGNNLVMWEGIKHLARNGCESLHLGRTSLQNNGLRRFKLAWGAEEEIIKYFRFDTSSGAWIAGHDRAAGFHNVIFRRLPLSLNRMIGSLIYRHLD